MREIAKVLFEICPITMTKIVYRLKMKKKLNLNNLSTLSDKISFQMLTDKDIKRSIYADKWKMRDIISGKGYDEYLVDVVGIYDSVDEIDFSTLPSKFVLKCNHGCKYNVICNDKNNFDSFKAKKNLNKWMKEKYGFVGGEFHYNDIEPKILCEKYIEGLSEEAYPIDYKVHCLNGKAEFILCCSDRERKLKLSVYDLNWNKLDVITDEYKTNTIIDKPTGLDKMIEIAEKISEGFPILRVDFYEINKQILIGELTVTPAAGKLVYFKREYDQKLGELVEGI